MAEDWYYAEGGAAKGPLDEQAILGVLLSQSDPLAVQVWKDGFDTWQAAGSTELEQLIRLAQMPDGRTLSQLDEIVAFDSINVNGSPVVDGHMVEKVPTSDQINDLVEAHWRTIINLVSVDANAATAEVFDFEDRVLEIASNLPGDQAAEFRATVARLRGELASIERENPVSVRERLGMAVKANEKATPLILNLETPTNLNPLPYLDQFWRVSTAE